MHGFYEQSLWIPQHFLITNPDLHHGLLGVKVHVFAIQKSGQEFARQFEGCRMPSASFVRTLLHASVGRQPRGCFER
jgi:hypothetical protein